MRVLLRVLSPSGDVLVTDGPAVTLTDRQTGEVLRYDPGLVVDDAALTDSMAWLSDSPAPREMAVTVLRAAPLDLFGDAEVSRLATDETDHADREILAVGRLRDVVVHGYRWDAVVTEDADEDDGLLLDPLAVVDASTFPRSDAQRAADGDPASTGTSGTDARVLGATYPIPIGYPGLQGIAAAGAVYGTSSIGGPGLLVESAVTAVAADQTILVAGDRIDATHIRRISTDGTGAPIGERLAVRTIHDRRGRPVSAVTPTPQVVVDEEEWVAFERADGGGILNPYGRGVLRRLDHVIRWALDRSTLRLDRSHIGALSGLREMQIDTVLTGQVRPWDWLRSEVLPLVPMSVAHGPRGLYLWPWLPALQVADTEMELEVGRNAVRDDPWQVVPLDGVSRVTVAYGLDARSGAMGRRWTLAGERRPDDDPTTVGLDYWAGRMRTRTRREGRPEHSTVIEAPIVCDDATAQLIARMAVEVRCRGQYVTTLHTARDERLRPGAMVRVVDASPTLDAVAQVEAVRYNDDHTVAVRVRAWEPTGPSES